MRVVIQRVKSASVSVEDNVVGKIEKGYLVLLGIEAGDEDSDLEFIVKKTINLRVFEDEDGKMNKSIKDIEGQILLVSQFTLLGDVRKGNRPSFKGAMEPMPAKEFYNKSVDAFEMAFGKIESGQFAADMQVSLINDGPVTIMLDSRKKF